MASSLVIQTSFLGDMVLTTPLLAQLANRGPVDVVATPAAASLLAGHPAVRTVIVYDKRGADRGLMAFLDLGARLRALHHDVAFLAQGSWRSAALAMLAGVPIRVGFSTSSGRMLYTKRVLYREDLHHAARLLQLARPNGREATPEELRPSLSPSREDVAAVDALLEQAGVRAGETLVGVAPGSVWGTKRWPFYPALAAALSGAARVVTIGGADDVALSAAIVAEAPGAVNSAGTLSLLASAELIRRCAVLVTNDSLPLHLASAMGTPTVAIFGPTVPAFGFGPLAPRSEVAGVKGLACRPCDRHGPARCPLGHHRCMRDLDVESIAAQVRGLLSNRNVPA